MTLSPEVFLDWLQNAARLLEQNRDYLTDLDAAIGDADHGINMDRGFRKIVEQLPSLKEKDAGTILKAVGLTLISSVGGAAGPLYGTFFLRAGEAIEGRTELEAGDLALLLRKGVEGVLARGRAPRGAKTMVDALSPALAAMETALQEGRDLQAAMRESVAAGEKGMKETIPMIATKGRASYLGPRSAGHQDPGATSSVLILKALAEALPHP
ncbi:MAG: dihydroxyacetone kinase subunit DhaL [Anaerolineales bacterium]